MKLAAWVTLIIAGMRVVGGTGEGGVTNLKCFMNQFCHEMRHDLWRLGNKSQLKKK